MDYEVVVVGGGIGGLTAAALLAARGLKVCLFERQSGVGGCIAEVEHFGYRFQPTYGLYSGWGPEGVFDRIFSELRADPPQVQALSSYYTVRLPDATDIPIRANFNEFQSDLRTAFPECAAAALEFYQNLALGSHSTPSVDAADMVANLLNKCSHRFRRFIDVQLQTVVQCSSDVCPAGLASLALNPQRQYWSIDGGPQALADTIAKSFKTSGGTLRLDTPVLRLAYGSDGIPIGIDLLSGERVFASRAIISNLTLWDTYGKLIGVSRTPKSVSAILKQVRSWGSYLIFLTLDSEATERLDFQRLLVLADWQEGEVYDPENNQLVLSIAPSIQTGGKLAATLSTFTQPEDWFTFHQDHGAHEERDHTALEKLWAALHAAVPELADAAEVLETATPQTFYDTTRRAFGRTGRPHAPAGAEVFHNTGKTIFPNVFFTSDTASDGIGVDGVAQMALKIADSIATNPFTR